MSKCVYQWCWRKENDFHFVEDQTAVTAAAPLSLNCYAPRRGFYTCSVFLVFLLLLFLPTSTLVTTTPTFFRCCNRLYSFSLYDASTAIFLCFVRFSETTAVVSLSTITLTCWTIDFCNGECECVCVLWGRKWVFRHLRKTFAELLSASSCLSVRPSPWNNSVPIGRIFMKFEIWAFFRGKKTVEKIQD